MPAVVCHYSIPANTICSMGVTVITIINVLCICVPFWLYLLALFIEIVQQTVVSGIEQMACQLGHARENVSSACTVFSSLKPSSKLTCSISGAMLVHIYCILHICTMQSSGTIPIMQLQAQTDGQLR